MKRKNTLVLAFLMFLYIGPSIFVMTSYGSTILAEPNTSKEFSPATDYEASDQSITSFSETLPDDTLYYPDSFAIPGIVTANGGNSSDYWRLNDTDSQYWESGDIMLYFDITEYISLDGFDYFLYSGIPDGEMSVYNYTSDAWDEIKTLANGWNNDTIISNDYFGDNLDFPYPCLAILLSGALYVDYLGVSFIGMIGTGYAESFADVSDWGNGSVWVSSSPEGTFTTDGDVASFEDDFTTGTDNDAWYSNVPSLSSVDYYYEIRYKVNDTAQSNYPRLYFFNNDDCAGNSKYAALVPSLTWTTQNGLISTISGTGTTIESVMILLLMRAGDDSIKLEIDYLRVSPADQMGWQHDGSTTIGISSADGGTITTDGDLTTLTADSDGSTFLIVADTTTTASAISTTYYPFFAIDIDSGSGSWALEQYDGSAYATLQSSTAIVAGIDRFNMAALDTYVSWWRITLTASSVLVGDWAKAYSIANYTVTQSGTSTDDVLYTDSGTLYCSGTSFTSFILDRDPALSVDADTYNLWTMTTSSGTPEIDFYVGAWAGYTNATSGTLDSGTLTDMRIKFTASADISAITFSYQLPEWNLINEIDLFFNIPYDEWPLNFGLIFLGLLMIPASTIYMAKGGREEVSMTKVFFALVAFILGWALFIGGIFA